tara:strand:- start:502 stop:732 length:231 start_codon:yes stop_codon:yes gene_type:complete
MFIKALKLAWNFHELRGIIDEVKEAHIAIQLAFDAYTQAKADGHIDALELQEIIQKIGIAAKEGHEAADHLRRWVK